MNKEYKITATIVLFNQDVKVLKETVNSFLKIPLNKKLFLVDNSQKNTLEHHFKNKDIQYIFNNKNVGFGKAHNTVLEKINSKYHLILNPDVTFNPEVIGALIRQLELHNDVSFITPKVEYPNKENQYVCRKHPRIYNLINRKLKLSQQSIFNNEYRDRDLTKPFYPDFIHGCFMLFKTADFKKLQGFDERYFLYLEDADICREIDKLGKKKLYYPSLQIVHQHQKGSAKNLRLFYYHISSAIKYFFKWGF